MSTNGCILQIYWFLINFIDIFWIKALYALVACASEGPDPASKNYRTHMGPKWVFIWVLYDQPIRGSWGICNTVPCWTHMGKAIWELHGSSMGKYGNYMAQVWEKSTHIYLPEKKKPFTHFIQMITSPQAQPIWWTGKVPTGRNLHTCASYCTCVESRGLKDIGVLFNSWKLWPHAYLYISQF